MELGEKSLVVLSWVSAFIGDIYSKEYSVIKLDYKELTVLKFSFLFKLPQAVKLNCLNFFYIYNNLINLNFFFLFHE